MFKLILIDAQRVHTDQIEGLHSRHCADIKNKPPELPQSGLCLLLKKRGGGLIFRRIRIL